MEIQHDSTPQVTHGNPLHVVIAAYEVTIGGDQTDMTLISQMALDRKSDSHCKPRAELLWHSACRIHFHCPQS